MTKSNRELVQEYLDAAWNQRDWSAAEKYVHPDVVFHDQVREGDLPPGREGLREVMKRLQVAFPDYEMNVQRMIAEDDYVTIIFTASGTQDGEFNGYPATGCAATMHAIAVVRLEDGQIVEGWQETDQLGVARQIGMIPKGQMPKLMARLMAARARRSARTRS